MCGIAVLLERVAGAPSAPRSLLDDGLLAQDIAKRLRQRGPDHFGVVDRSLGHKNGHESGGSPLWRLRLCSAVLHLRGDAVTPQPTGDADGNVLCWNGEVFGYRDAQGLVVDVEQGNDTQWLAQLLAHESREQDTQAITTTLQRIHGPFAFVWFHAATQRVFFGHDRFGRRSLLIHSDASEQLTALAASGACDNGSRSGSVEVANLERMVLSSVALSPTGQSALEFVEVPANGLFVLDLRHQQLEFHAYEPLISAPSTAISVADDRYNCGLPRLVDGAESPLDLAAIGLLTALSNAVGVRVRTIPANGTTRVGVLFSGGLDSVVLAALAHFHVVDPDEPIDLLNVCFDKSSQFQSPDRLAAQISYKELCALFPTRHWRFVCVNEDYDRVLESQHEIFALLRPCDTHMDFNIGAAFWCLSRCHGTILQLEHVGDDITHTDLNAFLTRRGIPSDQRDAEAAVQALRLFDAGEDGPTGFCSATKCKRKLKPGCPLGVCRLCCLKVQKLLTKLRRRSARDESDNVPVNDHEQRASRMQLAAMLPISENAESRVEELEQVYNTHWSSMERPLCRVHHYKQDRQTDGAPVVEHFQTASQQDGAAATEPYTTTARVVLVGIGADEQLGGYGRHKTAFVQGGEHALQQELARDMARIWKRNLGRDDRCISAHSREARFPFLDEDVVRYIASLPLTSVCDFAQPRGRGDKLVLRVAAALLGLDNCARLAKRAIQFGSRIAKHANVAAFGSNRQASGEAKIRAVTPQEDDA